jgi:hypothetical protein
MIATTRLSVASCSQSIGLPSKGSIARAMFGFFHGSVNSGNWPTADEKTARETIAGRITFLAKVSFEFPFFSLSSNSFQKLLNIDVGVAQCTFQRVTIDFVVKGKDYDAAIGMFHLHVTTFSMDFDEVKPLERREDLLA